MASFAVVLEVRQRRLRSPPSIPVIMSTREHQFADLPKDPASLAKLLGLSRGELRRSLPSKRTRLSKVSKPSKNHPDYAAPGERPFFTQRPEWNARARTSCASPAGKPAPGKRHEGAEKVIREQRPHSRMGDIDNLPTLVVAGLLFFVAEAATAIWFGIELELIRVE